MCKLCVGGGLGTGKAGSHPLGWRRPLPLPPFSVRSGPRGVQRGKVALVRVGLDLCECSLLWLSSPSSYLQLGSQDSCFSCAC